MFNLLNKNSTKYIDKSLKKYNDLLKEDINLIIRTKYNGRIYTSYVENIYDREVTFRCPIDEYEIIRFRKKSIIKVEFMSYTGLYMTKLLITKKIIKDGIVYYKGEINEPIERNQRRKNYRLPIELDLSYTLLPKETIEYSGNTLDISTNGMLMESCEEIPPKKEVKIKVDIDGKMYNIKGIILRRRHNYTKNTHLYNIKFDNLSIRNRNEISRYIFDNRTMIIE